MVKYVEENTKNQEFLRGSINIGGLKLNISSPNPNQALTEIRRIVESINGYDEVDDLTCFEMSTLLSEEFVSNSSAMNETKRLLNLEQPYRVVKEFVSAIEEIDLDNSKKQLHLESSQIRKAVVSLLSTVDKHVARHALVHIKGLLSEQERLVIIDHVHEQIPNAQIRAYQTEQDIEGKVLIEALLFGDFEGA